MQARLKAVTDQGGAGVGGRRDGCGAGRRRESRGTLRRGGGWGGRRRGGRVLGGMLGRRTSESESESEWEWTWGRMRRFLLRVRRGSGRAMRRRSTSGFSMPPWR